ncbi:hypothetical protein [Paenibacillus oralis]|nr:hypothetical protein [Paenibacillus oralis]
MDIDQVIDAKSSEFGFDKLTTLSIAELVSHIDNIKKRKKNAAEQFID